VFLYILVRETETFGGDTWRKGKRKKKGLITRKVPSLGQGCQFGTRRKKGFNLVPKLF